ncbi:hypothetical protein J5226_01960 [Lysobacter sp. K5869]|uniref:hypothetical protein n=1 Tax=Lysobacter sp. K5869 TaxID=2820808 RepID=UPI001C0614C9|nr:hypothetical protein [Lysobacter sp. K5869]QWP77193.1 hypothetical protein J5226_01960 [Lysobacter sp. K5869]
MSSTSPAPGSSAPRPNASSSAPAALSAFLRGVERRGAVLAELQAGDAAAGDAALVAAMAGFRAIAAETSLNEWPARFWSLLLTQPGLRRRTPVAIPLDATDRLGELGSGPRAALLLRLAAGLGETEASAVLHVAPATYRLALQRALPRHPDGRADPQAWQQLREQVHRRIKTLPPERLQRLAEAREKALQGAAPAASASARGGATPRPHPRWLMPLLWSLLALCALAFAATFWWPSALLGEGPEGVTVAPLPEGGGPAERYGREAGLIADGDFDLIADPQGEAAAADVDFRSWLAARDAGTIPAVAAPPPPETTPAATAPGNESPGLETDAQEGE